MEEKNVEADEENAAGGEAQLRQLLNALNETRNQVLKNTEAARSEIHGTFAELTKTLLKNVERRKCELVKEVETIRDDTLAPLTECCANVERRLQESREAAKAGQQEVGNGSGSSDDGLTSSLPEMPKPGEIPSVLVRFNNSAVQRCLTGILDLGHVSYAEPIKITEIREKPGALTVIWEEPETDFSTDVENVQYHLQFRQGDDNVNGEIQETEYRDAYVGPDTFCVVRNLALNVEHSFRVRRIGASAADEDEWSKVHVAKTTVSPYEWDPMEGDDYSTSDERRIATKRTSNLTALHSGGAQFRCSHSLQFAILERGSSGQSGEGLGLALKKIIQEGCPVRPGTIFVSCEGEFGFTFDIRGRGQNLHAPPRPLPRLHAHLRVGGAAPRQDALDDHLRGQARDVRLASALLPLRTAAPQAGHLLLRQLSRPGLAGEGRVRRRRRHVFVKFELFCPIPRTFRTRLSPSILSFCRVFFFCFWTNEREKLEISSKLRRNCAIAFRARSRRNLVRDCFSSPAILFPPLDFARVRCFHADGSKRHGFGRRHANLFHFYLPFLRDVDDGATPFCRINASEIYPVIELRFDPMRCSPRHAFCLGTPCGAQVLASRRAPLPRCTLCDVLITVRNIPLSGPSYAAARRGIFGPVLTAGSDPFLSPLAGWRHTIATACFVPLFGGLWFCRLFAALWSCRSFAALRSCRSFAAVFVSYGDRGLLGMSNATGGNGGAAKFA